MIKIGIIGGTGYTGVELLRLLASYSAVDLRIVSLSDDAASQ
jgi:N-acetyl-gamma-glutamyl-phosphate reductase